MLNINLKGKKAFVAGVGDDRGFGWAIAKSLAEAGATVIVGTWPPILNIFTSSLNSGKFDESRLLSDGSLLEFAKIYPFDAMYDSASDVPEDVKNNKRYASLDNYTISEAAAAIHSDFGSIDIIIHSLANAPEIKSPLVKTSRQGYLAALSASSYSFVSMISHFGPLMNKGGSALSLTYLASNKAIPGYGGGMSSAKAALESDTKTLAWEAGRQWGIRVNAISAGALKSRAASAIGFIDIMIEHSLSIAPIQENLEAHEVGNTAAFLSSSLASGITGDVIYVDKGVHVIGPCPIPSE